MSHDNDEAKVLPVSERGDFLDEKQKAVKQKMMEDMLEGFFGSLEKNKELFTMQSIIDLSTSVLIMFNREVLVHMLNTLNLTHVRKQIMKSLFEAIKNEVDNKIKKGMM